jgi:alcohol dehydrogenase class IV
MMNPFSIARLPRLDFGYGTIARLTGVVRQFGDRVLLVTGAHSLQSTPHWETLRADFSRHRIKWEHCTVSGEPSPDLVDETVAAHAAGRFDVVVAIGGGSALDAAKAIAGLLRVQRSVMDYLEGVGPELPYEGPSVPFIAVPTTAGTGSEATKNAVLSIQGKAGFKKSFRHDKLVAEYAIVDPDLLVACPPDIIAANGMDALTQLIESYVSIRSNAFTDALGISGMRAARNGLLPWYEQAEEAPEARGKMTYASLISGINLAQTGLGSVHGVASPLGAFYPIPHGVVCGTLVADATEINIRTMLEREPDNPALDKYTRVSEVLCQRRHKSKQDAWEALIDLLHNWTDRLKLPKLSAYGVQESGLDHIVAHSRGSSMKTNPIVLTDSEIRAVVERRL